MNRFKQKIFITGATGNLGSKLVLQLLEEERETQIIALVRGENQKDAESRLRNLLLKISPESNLIDLEHRLKVIKGDIVKKQFGLEYSIYKRLSEDITHIIHSAAATKFSTTLEEARLVNYTGTKNVLRFAALAYRSAAFKSLAHISTAYVCGSREGIIYEGESDNSCGFSNNYEQSKWEAEQLVRSKLRQIPLTIFRPSIIVGDSESGRISTFNVLYPPLKFLCQGINIPISQYSAVPLDVIPVDYAARSILHITLNQPGSVGKTFHIVAGEKYSCPVGEIIRLGRKLLTDETAEVDTVSRPESTTNSLWNRVSTHVGKISRISKFLNIYLPYISLIRDFDDTNTRQALQGSGISVQPLVCFLANIMKYSIETNWGKNIRSAA